MSEYSGYERKRAHALGPFSSVYEATAPDGKPGRFALKIFHPPASTSIRRAYAIEGWLLAAERQQKSAKKDGAVLEVLAFGRCAEGAYSITPWQEHSLEPLVETMAAKGDLLRALAECLLSTIEHWGTQTGGSHRKLKASNVFFTRSGPLAGMTAVMTDPWFLYGGAKTDAARVNDLTAVGAILAQIVRRRSVAAWPIEDAPEWKALGHAGKAWLAYCNYLLNPQPAAGELTMAEARKRLRKIPKDARPARKALLIGAAVVVVAAGAIVAFARFGDPKMMPYKLVQLAETLHNPRTRSKTPSEYWAPLCRAWDTWLGDLQANASRLLKTDGLWAGESDPLKVTLRKFVAEANRLQPGELVPEARTEKRMSVLADAQLATLPALYNALLLLTAQERISIAVNGGRMPEDPTTEIQGVQAVSNALEKWKRWDEMRALLKMIEDRQFPQAAAALAPRLPPAPGPGYKLDTVRTLKLFNDVSLDDTGTLLLARSWGEITILKKQMEESTDRVQVKMPELILGRLTDRSSVGDFAESLAGPLEELRQRRAKFLDPAVVRERFLKESVLQTETAAVTMDDFPRWEQELYLFSKVPAADDPRLVATLDETVTRLRATAVDLEPDAPAATEGGLATLSQADFEKEITGATATLASLRAREIVRIDLPVVSEDKTKLEGVFTLLGQRVETTLILLNPQNWLDKVAQAYGKFNETKQRWARWQATFAAVTAAQLDGRANQANRERFRELRRQERQVREWIDGLEGPDGLGALAVPDISAASADTAEALRQLESARREQAAIAAAAATQWTNALPTPAWAAAAASVRAPLEAHRQWLADLLAFSVDLDRLNALLAGGFSWNEGVSEVMDRMGRHLGVEDLTGRPAEWNTEAKLLGTLVASDDRTALTSAAQSGGLSRKLTAWRRLGLLTGWPAGADDLDIDGGVVAALRETVGSDVKDETRRGSLLEELLRETRVRWNRAARNSASNLAQMTAVYERMARYGIAEADLGQEALYNLKLWQLKRSDWGVVELGPLRDRRNAFVAAVRAIAGVVTQPVVAKFVDDLDRIELIVDPNRAPTPTPRVANWSEELIDDGLGLTATWKNGAKTVKLDFAVVQPADDTPPFYLAKRAIAVGDFIDLLATRPKEETTALLDALPTWTRSEANMPYNQPLAWQPRFDNSGNYSGLMLNPAWLVRPNAAVKGLLDNTALHPEHPELQQAAAETPTLRSPLQAIPPPAAKLFAEKMLGARLPTPREWEAVMKAVGTPASGNFRGPNFQNLFKFLREYIEAGQTVSWRPSEGIFLPRVDTQLPNGTTVRRPYVDDGAAGADPDASHLWFDPVETGPATGGFVNLTGNVSIFLYDNSVTPAQFYVAGGSALSPPGIDFTKPQLVEASGMVGAKAGTEAYTDVGIRPAFTAPPGFRQRFNLLVLVRDQKYLTW